MSWRCCDCYATDTERIKNELDWYLEYGVCEICEDLWHWGSQNLKSYDCKVI